jgi:hypothetical protein
MSNYERDLEKANEKLQKLLEEAQQKADSLEPYKAYVEYLQQMIPKELNYIKTLKQIHDEENKENQVNVNDSYRERLVGMRMALEPILNDLNILFKPGNETNRLDIVNEFIREDT